MGIVLALNKFGYNRNTILILNTFGYCNDTASIFVIYIFYILKKVIND